LAGALLAASAIACGGGDTFVQSGGQQTGISVNGTGRAFGSPDIALLVFGIQFEAATVESARDQAAAAQQAVIASVKANGVEDKDIQTQQFSIQPQYDFPGPGRVQVIRGYAVTNVINVKVRNINTTGKVLDDAARAGGNNTVVRGVSFTIDDPTELESEARALAVAEARDRAEELAQRSSAGVGQLISISEFTSRGGPEGIIAPRTGVAQAAADTPIQPGELEVVVNVSVVYAID
jgi:uncharacterized protein YggE